MKLSGWGRFPVLHSSTCAPRTEDSLRESVAGGHVIARGNGRAYGDSAIGANKTIQMSRFNHMLEFHDETGILVAEAGVLLADIITAFLPLGWFPPVTPGTKFVTLGGMIAADVHGKNHHKVGSFGGFVDWFDLMGSDGTVNRCSRHENTLLFNWTIGGMGLTGVILRAAVRLKPVQSGWMHQRARQLPNLDAVLAAFEESKTAPYSVAWIDCLSKGAALGRSVLMLAEHANVTDLSAEQLRAPFKTPVRRIHTVPFSVPSVLLNATIARLFNALYFMCAGRTAETSMVDWDRFFFPLDAMRAWNRIYGQRGVIQFQCVLPLETSRSGLQALLEATSQSSVGAFLSVLKRLGPQDSPFSFPMEGYTLAMDFPATAKAKQLMAELDDITQRFGGRYYLAKDSRMSAQTLVRSDPRAKDFAMVRENLGLKSKFQSKQSQRLGL